MLEYTSWSWWKNLLPKCEHKVRQPFCHRAILMVVSNRRKQSCCLISYSSGLGFLSVLNMIGRGLNTYRFQDDIPKDYSGCSPHPQLVELEGCDPDWPIWKYQTLLGNERQKTLELYWPAGDDTPTTTTTAHNNIKLIWNSHCDLKKIVSIGTVLINTCFVKLFV
jgi:hypothetical protein